MTEGQTGQNNMPPGLRSRGHKNSITIEDILTLSGEFFKMNLGSSLSLILCLISPCSCTLKLKVCWRH